MAADQDSDQDEGAIEGGEIASEVTPDGSLDQEVEADEVEGPQEEATVEVNEDEGSAGPGPGDSADASASEDVEESVVGESLDEEAS